MATYTLKLNRVDAGSVQTIVAKNITAEQVIELMITVKDAEAAEGLHGEYEEAVSEETEDVPDEEEDEPDQPRSFIPAPSQKSGKNELLEDLPRAQTKGVNTCGNCGKPGHNRKTCPELSGVAKPSAEGDREWYYQDILDMLRDGVEEEEIYKQVYTSITDAQYREALAWAKQQL